MKKISLSILLFLFAFSLCQSQEKKEKKEKKAIGLGLKAGYNFANVTGASQVNTASTNGYHFGAFYSPGKERPSGFGYRTEIIYSKQGYDFAKGNTTGTVKLDYILLPQLTTFNITKFVQLQAGLQLAFLINAGADSTVRSTATNANAANKVIDYYNKVDYGFAGGVEIRPFSGLLIGARLNISLADANKEQPVGIGIPSYIPDLSGDKLRNNVLQIFVGWKF